MTDHNMILEGIVGSTAYGLATEHSDIDKLGVYILPLDKVLAVGFQQMRQTRTSIDPDVTHHELGKFLALALKGNPTVTEILWLSNYTHRTDLGDQLIDHRRHLLGWRPVTSAYIGYASSQAERLVKRADENRSGYSSDLQHRTEKHGRHLWRLMIQAEHVLRTGEIEVDASEHADEIFEMGELGVSSPTSLQSTFEARAQWLRSISPHQTLPEYPDFNKTNEFLFMMRMLNS